jgi:hypothetical protein
MSFLDLQRAADRVARSQLGEPVTYTPGTGSPVEVNGVFDTVYVRVDGKQDGVSSSGPAVFLDLDDLPSNPEEDTPTVTVRGVTYSVREVQPDGTGSVVLLLYRA